MIDPKSELSRICLRMTPPDCGKRVWFLDLGHPAFGMSPLRLIGDRPLAIEAAQIAENVVAALLDINENQIYQSSRRYLYHAVIGAIAIAHREQTPRAKLEDVYTLLRPAKDEFRAAVAEACADQADLDQTAEFFRSELPDDLRMATSRVAERLDAPRNKISGLTGVPPLRRFFNHPTDIPLREIIEARDILIVDANMGAIGTENSKACMLFILRMLHAQLQRQVHLPERERPRVPLLVDEAHYVAGGENVVDQIATHRAAGLEPAFGLQYFAQLGSASEHQQKILKGVLNLLQSRFLFRMGDAAGRRAGHPDRDGRLLDHDPRRPRLPRPPARHPRAGAQLPQLLLPRLLDRPRHPRPELHRPDLPAPRRRRRMGRAPPRRPGRARRPLPRAARIDARRPRSRSRSRTATAASRRRSRAADVAARVPRRPLRARRTPPSDSERAGTRTRRAGTSPPEPTPSRSRAGAARSAHRRRRRTLRRRQRTRRRQE